MKLKKWFLFSFDEDLYDRQETRKRLVVALVAQSFFVGMIVGGLLVILAK